MIKRMYIVLFCNFFIRDTYYHSIQLSPEGEVNNGGYTDTRSVEVHIQSNPAISKSQGE